MTYMAYGRRIGATIAGQDNSGVTLYLRDTVCVRRARACLAAHSRVPVVDAVCTLPRRRDHHGVIIGADVEGCVVYVVWSDGEVSEHVYSVQQLLRELRSGSFRHMHECSVPASMLERLRQATPTFTQALQVLVDAGTVSASTSVRTEAACVTTCVATEAVETTVATTDAGDVRTDTSAVPTTTHALAEAAAADDADNVRAFWGCLAPKAYGECLSAKLREDVPANVEQMRDQFDAITPYVEEAECVRARARANRSRRCCRRMSGARARHASQGCML